MESRFFAAYLVAIAAVWAGVILVGSSLYGKDRPFATGWWLTIALAAVVTLRHHIPRTSTNSLEPYFHPRLLAFGLGIIAVAAFLRHRNAMAVGARQPRRRLPRNNRLLVRRRDWHGAHGR
jgi:hypothetical protein